MFTLNCKGKPLVLNEPVVMGIINTTPDSFYSDSRQATIEAALHRAEEMINQGAAILDIGGQSTRPGSQAAGPDAEIGRVGPVIEAIAKRFPDTLISVDTFYASVAELAVDSGAVMVNDISGGSFDPQMMHTAGRLSVPYIAMHLEGNMATMHQPHTYADLMQDMIAYFVRKTEACKKAGIQDLIIDPGFGFSKTPEENFHLVRDLDLLKVLNRPILLGVSRKSTIYKTLGITPEQALNGTTVLNTAGLLKGAHILRVHDVKEAMEAITLTRYLL